MEKGERWTPSKVIHRLGKEIGHEDSVAYWAWKNDIPIFCPALTDGSLGDMMYFFSYKRPEFVVDIVADIKRINDLAVRAKKTGVVILGGGLVKHHTCNANLMRNGADYAVSRGRGREGRRVEEEGRVKTERSAAGWKAWLLLSGSQAGYM